MTTAPPPLAPIAPCGKPECQCAKPGMVVIDAERLRKLRDGLTRNTTALTRIIDAVLAECEEHDTAA